MNPYLSFGLAMCVIVFLALAATAYMAVFFNRRSKADLDAALAPLAESIDGQPDADEAKVVGRYLGHIASGEVRAGPAGAGRYFHTKVIDGAGGVKWTWTAQIPKRSTTQTEPTFDCDVPGLEVGLIPYLAAMSNRLLVSPGWLRVDYDPIAGHLQLTRPMLGRRDVPDRASFQSALDDLVEIASQNRSVQEEASL